MSLIGRYLWIPDWCYFPRSLGSSPVWEIWILIDKDLFLSLSIGRSIRQMWYRSGDMEFSRDFDRDIVRATGSSIRRP